MKFKFSEKKKEKKYLELIYRKSFQSWKQLAELSSFNQPSCSNYFAGTLTQGTRHVALVPRS